MQSGSMQLTHKMLLSSLEQSSRRTTMVLGFTVGNLTHSWVLGVGTGSTWLPRPPLLLLRLLIISPCNSQAALEKPGSRSAHR